MGTGARRAARLAKKQRELPPNAACADCGAHRIIVLTKVDGEVVCYRCLNRRRGLPAFELHHFVAAKVTPEVIPLPANDHRIVEDLKYDYPPEVWTNPHGRAILMAVAVLAMAGALGYCLARYCTPLGRSLLRANDWLTTQHGRDWEASAGLAAFGWEGASADGDAAR